MTHMKFQYPKLFLLVIFSIISYFIFSNDFVQSIVISLGELSYLGIFIAGLFFSFGFTTPFAIGFFLTVGAENIFIAALIGGCGALISDILIFKLIRFSFMDEFKRLEKTRIIHGINALMSGRLFSHFKLYLLYFFAGLIISSPLPDELGISMLAGLTRIKLHTLALISFVMNTFGIFLILLI